MAKIIVENIGPEHDDLLQWHKDQRTKLRHIVWINSVRKEEPWNYEGHVRLSNHLFFWSVSGLVTAFWNVHQTEGMRLTVGNGRVDGANAFYRAVEVCLDALVPFLDLHDPRLILFDEPTILNIPKNWKWRT